MLVVTLHCLCSGAEQLGDGFVGKAGGGKYRSLAVVQRLRFVEPLGDDVEIWLDFASHPLFFFRVVEQGVYMLIVLVHFFHNPELDEPVRGVDDVVLAQQCAHVGVGSV